MMIKKQCIFNWSGGKDSTLALHYALQDPSIEIKYLVTTITETYKRVSMHGVRQSLLIKQAKSIGIPLHQIFLPDMPDMATYDEVMKNQLLNFKAEGITHAIYGDIFLKDLRTYREEKLAEVGLQGIFPLWNQNTKTLISDFLNLGYKTIIVCCQNSLKSICGKILNNNLISNLPPDVDPCGENGEFHTFAFKGPVFKNTIDLTVGALVFKTFPNPAISNDDNNLSSNKSNDYGFWYIDLK